MQSDSAEKSFKVFMHHQYRIDWYLFVQVLG